MSDIFPVLFAAHMIGDWIVQSDAQAANKMKSWRAMMGHVGTYHLTMLVIVLPFWHDWWFLLALALSASTHAFIDRRWPVRLLLEKTGSRQFSTTTLGMLSADQALHIAVLAAMAVIFQYIHG